MGDRNLFLDLIVGTLVLVLLLWGGYRLLSSSKPTALPVPCAAAIQAAYPSWAPEDCQRVCNEEIWIGMTPQQLLESWGKPWDAKRTVSASLVHDEYIYPANPHMMWLYFLDPPREGSPPGPNAWHLHFDNGVLTSWSQG